MRKTVAVLCAAAFALSACGQGDGEAKDKIAESVKANADVVSAGAELTDEQAECFADGMVDEVGVEKLQEYKLIDGEYNWLEDADPKMSEGDAKASAGVITDCVDFAELMMDQVNADADSPLTEEQAECFGEALDNDDVEAFLATSLQGKEGGEEEFTSALMGCVMAGLGDTTE